VDHNVQKGEQQGHVSSRDPFVSANSTGGGNQRANGPSQHSPNNSSGSSQSMLPIYVSNTGAQQQGQQYHSPFHRITPLPSPGNYPYPITHLHKL